MVKRQNMSYVKWLYMYHITFIQKSEEKQFMDNL